MARQNQGGSHGGRGRGFAGMDAQQQREIARKGGAASAATQARDARGRFGGSSNAGRGASSGTGQSQNVGQGTSRTVGGNQGGMGR